MDKQPTLEQLRAEVQRAICETSARSVARELVVSVTGLLKFSQNPRSTIYRKTHKKLVSWYHGRAAGRPDEVQAAVDVVDP